MPGGPSLRRPRSPDTATAGSQGSKANCRPLVSAPRAQQALGTARRGLGRQWSGHWPRGLSWGTMEEATATRDNGTVVCSASDPGLAADGQGTQQSLQCPQGSCQPQITTHSPNAVPFQSSLPAPTLVSLGVPLTPSGDSPSSPHSTPDLAHPLQGLARSRLVQGPIPKATVHPQRQSLR